MPLELETQWFVNTIASQPSLSTLSPQYARKMIADIQAHLPNKPLTDVEERLIPGGPTSTIRVNIVRPRGEKVALPAVVFFHGGGWMLGDFNTHNRLVSELASRAGAVVIFVEYDRAPEAQYPVAIEQAYAVTKYVAENAMTLNVDSSRLVVAGDGAGGNIAAAVTLLAKERCGPKIAFQLLLYPVTDANFDTGSYREFADGPWLTRDMMRRFWDAYLWDVQKRYEPTASPLQASQQQLKGLPPAFIITSENDVLRDEGEAYAAKLSQAGVSVTAVRYLGTIHDFMMINPLADTPAAREAVNHANSALRAFFNLM